MYHRLCQPLTLNFLGYTIDIERSESHMGYPKGSHSGSHMGSIEYSPKWKKKQQRISKKFQKKYERNCGKCITTKASKEEIERLLKEME